MNQINVLICLLATITILIPLNTGFAFEKCNNATMTGNCTLIVGDGAIGIESKNTIWIQDGYVDYGVQKGCPYQNNTCPNGFAYFGWAKFKAYPSTCNDFGVLVATQVFNIHLLGNGHLATYAWLPNGTEYYAESLEPAPLNVFLPIIVIFQYLSNNNTWRLVVIVQSQLISGAVVGRPRTYTPPKPNLFFAGSGDGPTSHNISVQLDRTGIQAGVKTLEYYYQVLLDVKKRQAQCVSVNGILVESLTCYWIVPEVANWTSAYSNCSSTAYPKGYPYARLAWFPSWNPYIWNNLTTKIASYGNGSTGYTAWIGGGHRLQWLYSNMTSTNVKAVVPQNVTYNSDGASSTSCLQIDTKTYPWQWSETNCATKQRFICEMSYDCLLTNPCKNLGVCQVFNDGQNICKCWPGTSGQFCENGLPSVNCVNNCPCGTPSIPMEYDNCSLCIVEIKAILKILTILKLKLKLLLSESDFDLSQYQALECSFSTFENATISILNDLRILSCEIMLKIFAKLQAEKYLFQKILCIAQHRLSSYLPSEIINLWFQANNTELHLSTLPCFQKILNVMNSSDFELIMQVITNNRMQGENDTIYSCSEDGFEGCQHYNGGSSEENVLENDTGEGHDMVPLRITQGITTLAKATTIDNTLSLIT